MPSAVRLLRAVAVAWLFALQGLAFAQLVPPPVIAAQAYLLLDVASGQVIAAENGDERREPASLTKLMTAYLVFAALRDKSITPSQQVPVSTAAWHAEARGCSSSQGRP
jgi:D-alanyl-D-alanine carboxypeptidase (penicillin-binding protein 5/6)